MSPLVRLLTDVEIRDRIINDGETLLQTAIREPKADSFVSTWELGDDPIKDEQVHRAMDGIRLHRHSVMLGDGGGGMKIQVFSWTRIAGSRRPD